MANEVLFWHGEKVKALASGRKLGLNNVNGSRAAIGTLTGDGSNVSAADTVTLDTNVYTFKTALAEAKAAGTLTSDATATADGDTVTINGRVYTFQTTLTNVAGHIHIGASATIAMTNLFNGINATGGTVGTDYATLNVANPDVVATNPTATTVVLTAKSVGVAGNSLATTETSAHLSFGAVTLVGGVNSIANEVIVRDTAAHSLTALFEAINAGANGGTDYSSATVAHPTVSATNPSGTTVVVTALVAGSAANTIATTETAAHLSFGGFTLSTGVDADVLVDPITGFPGYETFALVTTAGGDTAFALPIGDEAQEIVLYLKTKGGSSNAVIAGAFVGGTHLTLSAANQATKLKYLNGSWLPLTNTGALA